MTENERPNRSRAADALRDLNTGADLARRRVWRRVEAGIADDRRGRRRLGWAVGIAASAVAAIAILLPTALNAARAWYEPSQQEQQRVAVNAVLEMLGQQPGGENGESTAGSDNVDQFVQYLVTSTEAKPGAR